MGRRDIFPKWSIQLYSSVYQPYMNKQYYQPNKLGYLSVSLPGFYRHHSLVMMAEIEDGFGLRLSLPRGYLKQNYSSIYYRKQYSINYTCPLVYPDFSAGPIFYLKRIYANFFYDYTDYKNYMWQNSRWKTHNGNLQSAGIELNFNTHFLRFIIPFEPEIQYSYLISTRESQWAFYVKTGYSFALGNRFSDIDR